MQDGLFQLIVSETNFLLKGKLNHVCIEVYLQRESILIRLEADNTNLSDHSIPVVAWF